MAEIRDSEKNITITARVNGQKFEASVTRREMTKWVCSEPHYFVQDVMGEGFGKTSNWGKGVGRFLCNLAVQYLQHLADPNYRLVCGEFFDMPNLEPEERATFRRDFFARHGAEVTGDNACALVSDLLTIPAPLPFVGGDPVVVPLSEFH